MRTADLNAVLAERVMGWRVGPDRFLTGERGWIPRWRFQPTEQIGDALQLLTGAAPQEYKIVANKRGQFDVQTVITGCTGRAVAPSLPLAITLAVARAIGIIDSLDGEKK